MLFHFHFPTVGSTFQPKLSPQHTKKHLAHNVLPKSVQEAKEEAHIVHQEAIVMSTGGEMTVVEVAIKKVLQEIIDLVMLVSDEVLQRLSLTRYLGLDWHRDAEFLLHLPHLLHLPRPLHYTSHTLPYPVMGCS